MWTSFSRNSQRKSIDCLLSIEKTLFCLGLWTHLTILRDCDVYVFPSFMEGSAKSVYEAMQSGLACVVSPSSGSIITDGQDGLLSEAGDSETLREKMLLLKKKPSLRHKLGLAAQKKSSSLHLGTIC